MQYNYITVLKNVLISDALLNNTNSQLASEHVSIVNLFLFSDFLAYIWILLLVFITGKFYSSNHFILTRKLVTLCEIFCYALVFIYVFGIFIFYNVLICKPVIFVFSGLYFFSLWTQSVKILLVLLIASFYTFFPSKATTGASFRSLEVPLLLQITLALSITIMSSNNFALTLLSLEGFSLTLYIMTALGRNYGGVTASVKYFAFGTLGSIFLFWGVVHVYSLVPTLSISVADDLLNGAYKELPSLGQSADFATTAIAFGFMLKLGAAPTHQWVADTYAGVHTYITAYFAIFVKCVIFLTFMIFAYRFNCDALLSQFTIFSLIIGCFMSINQTELKRLLAYSSIVHVGFLFMGDLHSSLLYLLTYMISSLVIFISVLNSSVGMRELIYVNDLRFMRGKNMTDTFALSVALASSAGLPPLCGFYGKFAVWVSLVEDIYLTNDSSIYATLFVSIGISLISIFYYMRVVAYLFLSHDKETFPTRSEYNFSDFWGVVLSAKGFLTILLIFWTLIQSYISKIIDLSLISIA